MKYESADCNHANGLNYCALNILSKVYLLVFLLLHILQFPDFPLCLLSQSGHPVATFKQHSAPITSVEWSPIDSSVFAASGADDVVSQWDLSVESCDMGEQADGLKKLPPQLLFLHQGQTEVKELHWHPQIHGTLISTALSGFNVFRTISV